MLEVNCQFVHIEKGCSYKTLVRKVYPQKDIEFKFCDIQCVNLTPFSKHL